ncbi:hypothetical protein LINGRAHAP2_LOCUS22427 [Linum grandiflorum]
MDLDFISMFDLASYLADVGYLQQVGTTSMEEYRLQNECSYFWCKEIVNREYNGWFGGVGIG